MTSPVLRVEGVSAAEGHPRITFDVVGGRCLGLLGASPTYTSRLLLTAAGLVKPVTGRVAIVDVDVLEAPERARRQVAVTCADCIDRRLRLHEYLSSVSRGRTSMGTPVRASVTALVERLGLDRSRPLSSPAARAEAALAAALLPSVSLVILDEPFRDINAHTRAQAIDWIRALADESVAVVIGGEAERDLRAISHTVLTLEPAP